MTDKKVCLVTGGNIGIGYETCKGLALSGYGPIILACRSEERGREAIKRLEREMAELEEVRGHLNPSHSRNTSGSSTSGSGSSQSGSGSSGSRDNGSGSSVPAGKEESRFIFLPLDLEDLDSVDELARQFRQLGLERLDVLVCNAGILPLSGAISKSKQGYEKTFAVNHLGHFLLILQLLPALIAAGNSRVVLVSSMVHQYGRIRFDDINCERASPAPTARDLYAQSKLANVLCAYELQRRYGHLGLVATAVHPGVVGTDILKEAHCFIRMLGPLFMRLIGRSPAQGAMGSLLLATSPHYKGGEYLDKEELAPSAPVTYDAATAARLWDLSLSLVNASSRVSFDFHGAADLSGPYPSPPPPRPSGVLAYLRRNFKLVIFFAVLFFFIFNLFSSFL